MAIYLEFDGIGGNVTAAGYEGQVKIDTASFSVTRDVSMEAGNMSNRESGKPSFSGVSLSKSADGASAAFFKSSILGAAGKKATLRFVQTGDNDELKEFISYELENCIVSHFSFSASGDDLPYESINLSYSKCTISYTGHDLANKGGGPSRFGYDVAAGKAA